jgi:hypothetical protein
VSVGVDHDTSAFAVASIRRWWAARGAADHRGASRLLITADAGASNSYRYPLWKAELAVLAADTGMTITVCHFPPGTSKWNKIEHRLFSQITMNWRGRPLTSHQVVVATIAATRTRTGLRVAAELDPGSSPLGAAVPADQLCGCRSPRTPGTAPETTASCPPAPVRSAPSGPTTGTASAPRVWRRWPIHG